jgi:hypothetical protein
MEKASKPHLVTLCYVPYADSYIWYAVGELDIEDFLNGNIYGGTTAISQDELIGVVGSSTLMYHRFCCSLEQSPKQQKFCFKDIKKSGYYRLY